MLFSNFPSVPSYNKASPSSFLRWTFSSSISLSLLVRCSPTILSCSICLLRPEVSSSLIVVRSPFLISFGCSFSRELFFLNISNSFREQTNSPSRLLQQFLHLHFEWTLSHAHPLPIFHFHSYLVDYKGHFYNHISEKRDTYKVLLLYGPHIW